MLIPLIISQFSIKMFPFMWIFLYNFPPLHNTIFPCSRVSQISSIRQDIDTESLSEMLCNATTLRNKVGLDVWIRLRNIMDLRGMYVCWTWIIKLEVAVSGEKHIIRLNSLADLCSTKSFTYKYTHSRCWTQYIGWCACRKHVSDIGLFNSIAYVQCTIEKYINWRYV